MALLTQLSLQDDLVDQLLPVFALAEKDETHFTRAVVTIISEIQDPLEGGDGDDRASARASLKALQETEVRACKTRPWW